VRAFFFLKYYLDTDALPEIQQKNNNDNFDAA
jgi:hypothetical protein